MKFVQLGVADNNNALAAVDNSVDPGWFVQDGVTTL